MTMKFYDALQLDPAILKQKIAACNTGREKTYYWIAMAARSVLIVAFAIVFISLLSGVFGADNTPLAVALFCIMLGIRFVNFEYCIGDSLVTLAAALAILVLAPSAAAVVPPVFFGPAALHGLFCPALHDCPAAGNGERRLIQLCLHLSDREPGGWRGSGSPWTFGAGRLFNLRHDPVY